MRRQSREGEPRTCRGASAARLRLDEAKDEESGLPLESRPVLRPPLTHRRRWEWLDEPLDQEPGVGDGRAERGERLTPEAERVGAVATVPRVLLFLHIEVGAALAQPVCRRMLRREDDVASGPNNTEELAQAFLAIIEVVDHERADDQVERRICERERFSEVGVEHVRPAAESLP